MTPDNKDHTYKTDKNSIDKQISELEAELDKLKSRKNDQEDTIVENIQNIKINKEPNSGVGFALTLIFFVGLFAFYINKSKQEAGDKKVVDEQKIEKPKLTDERIKELANYHFRDSMLKNYSDKIHREIKNGKNSGFESDYNMKKFAEELDRIRLKLIIEHDIQNADLIISHISNNLFLKDVD